MNETGASASPLPLHSHPTDEIMCWPSQRCVTKLQQRPQTLIWVNQYERLPSYHRGSHMWMRYVTRFFITGSRSSPPRSKEDSQKIYCPTTTTLQRSQALQKRVDDPQVILRPNLSTRGRSDQQRLFLRHPAWSTTLVWTVQPTRSNAGEGKQGQDSNLTSIVLCRPRRPRVTPLIPPRHLPERRQFLRVPERGFLQALVAVTGVCSRLRHSQSAWLTLPHLSSLPFYDGPNSRPLTPTSARSTLPSTAMLHVATSG